MREWAASGMGPHPHDNEADKLRLLAFGLLLCPDMLFTHQGFEHVVGQGACVGVNGNNFRGVASDKDAAAECYDLSSDAE